MSKVVALKTPAEPLSFDQQLLRIAGDPKIPVARLAEIAELRRRIRLEDAEEAFNEALVAVQAEIGVVEPDKQNKSTSSQYATLYAVEQRLRSIYGKHGFALSFNTGDAPAENTVRVLCYVSRGAYTRTYQRDVVWTTKGPKGNDVCTVTHAQAGAETYGKRYLELDIFHITIGDDTNRADHDGNSPDDDETITAAEAEHLRALLRERGFPESRLTTWARVPDINDIRARNYDACVSVINGNSQKASS